MDKELSKSLRDALADPDNEIISTKARNAVNRINNVAYDEISKLLFEVGSPILLKKLLSDTIDSIPNSKSEDRREQTYDSIIDSLFPPLSRQIPIRYSNSPQDQQAYWQHNPGQLPIRDNIVIHQREFYHKKSIKSEEQKVKFFQEIGPNTNIEQPRHFPFRRVCLLTKIKLLFPESFGRKDVLRFIDNCKMVLYIEGTDSFDLLVPDYFIDSRLPIYNLKMPIGAGQSFCITISNKQEGSPIFDKDEILSVYLTTLTESNI